MKLKTIALVTAIAQLPVVLCQMAQWIHNLVELVNGTGKWEYEGMYILPMPIYLFASISLTVFLFTLTLKQKSN